MHTYINAGLGLMADGDLICFIIGLWFFVAPVLLVVATVSVVHGEVVMARQAKARKAKIAADLAAYYERKAAKAAKTVPAFEWPVGMEDLDKMTLNVDKAVWEFITEDYS